jgi:riboflavin kinase
LPKIVFKGTVFSGTGNGKKFVDLPWVKRQIEEKLGFSPYSGTLNIHLTKEGVEKKALLENSKGIGIEPQVGYCPGILFKACMDALECAVVIPKVPNYPSDVLEVIAPVCLRRQLKLVDGSLVAVSVTV